MDWGRAKTILIVSFLFLNLLLGYQMWASRWDQSNSVTETALNKEETHKILADKSIRVLNEVPKDTPKLKQVSVKFDDKYSHSEIVTFATPIKYINLLGKKRVGAIISKTPIENAKQYQLDNALSKNDVYVYHQMLDEIPMFDVTLTLFDKKGEITGYKQAYVEVQSGEEQKEEKIISAYTAIRSLADKYLPKGAAIMDVKLGYHGKRFDSQTHTMLPFWRVILTDGEIYYVQAFTGAIEGNQEQAKE